MMAVLTGGLIIIWLALSAGRTLLNYLQVELHRPAAIAAPLLLAVLESVLFLCQVRGTSLLPESEVPLALSLLLALTWGINGLVAAKAVRAASLRTSTSR
ncbi:hypothetical protein B5T_03377 [Alloalcanivorax dieselolei B5]|uniref:Uncharacterized protein n=1 Tax=Alcanivorax dieselolei (strain DSM 16502 / CGMCC 1.3690 / MCCC 1A00001 / B-5) TaxID=930169 RepID=K0CDF7_ALCDB|nr:hypothetical protein [Alloalcanivorax dieselolei]AFT71644.1 hypothetical protein B5T_03377 [Alloalcanivorax dieselolei B5]GGJ89142.1 hypothetical protein GCM10007426_18050 [Alloalcanivorax dieselolei]